jgi:hypothetical protein
LKGGGPRSGGRFLSVMCKNPLGFAVSPFIKGNKIKTLQTENFYIYKISRPIATLFKKREILCSFLKELSEGLRIFIF